MKNDDKKRYMDGCFCADWIDVDVNSISQEQKQVRIESKHKDLQTLLAELEEIKRNFEHIGEKQRMLENLMKFNQSGIVEG